MLNPFVVNNDAFSVAALTQAVNLIPNTYGRIRELNIFPARGIRSRTVLIEEKNGTLVLLPSLPPGAPAHVNKKDKRKLRSFIIPHIPFEDVITAEDLQDIRAFGKEDQVKILSEELLERLERMRASHALTLEHLRAGALNGTILDADGDQLYNLFDEFGITAKTVSFALSTAATNVPQKCRQVLRHIEDNLLGDSMTSVHCLCGPNFLDAFVAHSSVKEAYLNHAAAVEKIGGDPRKGFRFSDIVFEEYRGKGTDPEGNIRQFVGEDDAQFYPKGTNNTFETIFAPGSFLDTVNQKGQQLYARQQLGKHNRYLELYTESNPLPICKRPGVLVKGTK